MQTAFDLLLSRARMGNDEAQFEVGLHYQVQLQNVDSAIAWYKASAAQGHAKAKLHLALLYQSSSGGFPDFSKAAALHLEAATSGIAAAAYHYGILCLLGKGRPLCAETGIHWLTVAANSGNILAAYKLGCVFQEGQLVPRDDTRAADLFKRVALSGLSKQQPSLEEELNRQHALDPEVQKPPSVSTTRVIDLPSRRPEEFMQQLYAKNLFPNFEQKDVRRHHRLVQEAARVIASVDEAREILARDLLGWNRRGSLAQEKMDLVHEIASISVDRRPDALQDGADVIWSAARAGETKFFSALGKAITQKPADRQLALKRLYFWLIEYWTRFDGDAPPLCLFLHESLNSFAQLLNLKPPSKNTGQDTIRDAYRRLKLRFFEEPVIFVERVEGTGNGRLFYHIKAGSKSRRRSK